MFHRHKWKIVGTHLIPIYKSGKEDDYPIAHRTDISQVCVKCGEATIKQVDGVWSENGKGSIDE